MKKIIHLCLTLMLIVGFSKITQAQTTSGIITYEGMRKLDPSQIRVVINGDVVQPGSPEAPDIPDVATFSQQLLFTNNYAKEVRENPGPVIRRFEGTPGEEAVSRPVKVEPPLIENTFLDLANTKYVRVLEIKKDSSIQHYQVDEPFKKAIDWQETNKTKKIAGYTCKKATATWKNETYTLWYTTDLNFTYSPINGLLPQKGVVMEIEGSGESFKATRVEAKPITENEIQPATQGKKVSAQQFEDIRAKEMADFRQKMFSGTLPGN